MRIAVKTLGCKSNRYESDKLVNELGNLGKSYHVFSIGDGLKIPTLHSACVPEATSAFFSDATNAPDVLVVNTCTVTQAADRKSRQAIYGLKRLFPSCKVIVFGCGSNVEPAEYKKLEGVDFVARSAVEILKIIKKLSLKFPEKSSEYIRKNPINKSLIKRTRALIKIQDGCDNFCAYCIVPRARGREVSYSGKKILSEVIRLEKEGYKEIVLTGINTGGWREKNMDISALLELLIKNTESARFRLSSIEPENFSEKFYKLFKTGRLCSHIHMSLQSGSNLVLKRMRRNYSTEEFLEICKKFKKNVPDIGLTTDVIVGFPGETEKEFGETCKFVEKIGFLKVHVFPYSKRKNTAAYYMKNQIPENAKKSRAETLRKISDKISLKFKAPLLGKTYEILVENPRGKFYRGFTPNYIPVQFLYTGKKAMVGDFVNVRLEKVDRDGTVCGNPVDG